VFSILLDRRQVIPHFCQINWFTTWSYNLPIWTLGCNSIYEVINSSYTIRHIQSPDKIDHRYLLEDIGYGLVPMAYIARLLAIQTPTIDSLINIACILNNVNHWNIGLDSKKLGITQTDLIGLKRYLDTGMYIA
jgi:NAD/NADP octopine/nopaline dehydrogenase-like protein